MRPCPAALKYSIDQLNADLASEDGLVDLSFEIETHEYGPDLEAYVTQADLGLVIKYDDCLLPPNSWSRSWLLQAKRVSPDRRHHPQYTETASFRSHDSAQHSRIVGLRNLVGHDFIRYLLYCPRAEFLDPTTKLKLQHLRNSALAGHIFDYALGLELREDLLSPSSTVDAGIFVSLVDDLPSSLGSVYQALFHGVSPFAWFILSQFGGNDRIGRSAQGKPFPDSGEHGPDIARGIVSGDQKVIKSVLAQLGEETNQKNFRFLPPHTLTIGISVGQKLSKDFRQIRKIDLG